MYVKTKEQILNGQDHLYEELHAGASMQEGTSPLLPCTRAWGSSSCWHMRTGGYGAPEATFPSPLLNKNQDDLRMLLLVILRGIPDIFMEKAEHVTCLCGFKRVCFTYRGLGGLKPQSCTGSCWWSQTARGDKEKIICKVPQLLYNRINTVKAGMVRQTPSTVVKEAAPGLLEVLQKARIFHIKHPSLTKAPAFLPLFTPPLGTLICLCIKIMNSSSIAPQKTKMQTDLHQTNIPCPSASHITVLALAM